MKSERSALRGKWRITKMELWDRDYLDLEVPAHITFESDRLGSFQFGAVRGWVDYRKTKVDGHDRIDFSWEGFNDADPSCGRGWALVSDGRLVGHLYLHNGDDSSFIAERASRRGAGTT